MFGGHIQEHQQELRKSISSSFYSLEKGGEGSKGGKVIGHTESGKAKYDQFQHHRLLAAYHAAKAHDEKGNDEKVKHHLNESQVHVQQAKKLHNKKNHGGWIDSIPDTKDAREYGDNYYKLKNKCL